MRGAALATFVAALKVQNESSSFLAKESTLVAAAVRHRASNEPLFERKGYLLVDSDPKLAYHGALHARTVSDPRRRLTAIPLGGCVAVPKAVTPSLGKRRRCERTDPLSRRLYSHTPQ